MFLWHKKRKYFSSRNICNVKFFYKTLQMCFCQKRKGPFHQMKDLHKPCKIYAADQWSKFKDTNWKRWYDNDLLRLSATWILVTLWFFSFPQQYLKEHVQGANFGIARSNNVSENPHDWFSGNGPGRFWSPVDSPSWKVSGCCPGLDRAQESTGGRARQHCQRFDQSEQSRRSPDPLDQSEADVCRPMGVEVVWRQHHRSQDSRRRKLQFLRFQIHKNTNTNK